MRAGRTSVSVALLGMVISSCSYAHPEVGIWPEESSSDSDGLLLLLPLLALGLAQGSAAIAADEEASCESTYASAIRAEAALVSYWRFEDISDGSAEDELGRNSATITGTPAAVASIACGGQASSHDGSNYWIAPDNDTLDFNFNEDFAIELWASIPSTQLGSGRVIVSKWGAGPGYPFSVRYGAGSGDQIEGLRFDTTNAPQINTGAVADTGFRHLVFQRNSGTLEIYLDGSLVTSTADTTSASTQSAGDLTFAAQTATSAALTAVLDEIAIYNAALSQATISEHYRLGLNL